MPILETARERVSSVRRPIREQGLPLEYTQRIELRACAINSGCGGDCEEVRFCHRRSQGLAP